MINVVVDTAVSSLQVIRLGEKPYIEVWKLQKELQQGLMDGDPLNYLVLCTHPPTITAGRNSKTSSLIATQETLRSRGVSFYEIERGGDMTFHGPGQIVAYPILNLKKFRTDVGWYMRTLEEIVIRTLQHFGIAGTRIPGKTGVWVADEQSGRKIAAIGVRISRWCTLHGLSLNVKDCSDGFSLIHPCGMAGVKVTSLEQEGISAEVAPVEDHLIEEFKLWSAPWDS